MVGFARNAWGNFYVKLWNWWGFDENNECLWVDEVGMWLLAMIFLSTSKAPNLHQTCVISKNSCKQEEFSWARKAELNELTVYLMHEEIDT